jgi:hypothetical protein
VDPGTGRGLGAEASNGECRTLMEFTECGRGVYLYKSPCYDFLLQVTVSFSLYQQSRRSCIRAVGLARIFPIPDEGLEFFRHAH